MTKMPDYEKLEYERLSSEIVKDRELQFRLFWQSITVTAIIFSFCASIFQSDFWFKFPFVILAPHLILIPTSTIILNRATRPQEWEKLYDEDRCGDERSDLRNGTMSETAWLNSDTIRVSRRAPWNVR